MNINWQLFYQKLGNLFYAIANADSTVRKAEEQQLGAQINEIWIPRENKEDEFGTNLANYIFISFDYLHGQGIKADSAFKDFSDYYKLHEQYFDKTTKLKILKTAEVLSDAFAARNKNESLYLERLKNLMQL